MFFHKRQIFFKYLHRNNKNVNAYINEKDFYYLALHVKLSTFFYSTQLIDVFAYEVPLSSNFENKNKALVSVPALTNSILVYNFHSILFQQRFFIFVIGNSQNSINKLAITKHSVQSITELFPNANWLEREAAELHGIFFSGKKDLRNLMLVYGDTSAPMRKSFPSIGIREIFYDSVSDLLAQTPVTIQF